MAEGRFVSKSIAHDLQLNSVSLEADYLFTRCIPFLDREGRMDGHPEVIRAKVCPMRSELDAESIRTALAELQGAGLVRWYRVGDRVVLDFPGFEKNQKGLRKDREAESKFPPPEDGHPIEVAESQMTLLDDDLLAGSGDNSGAAPESSERTPAEVEVNGSEVNGREGNGDGGSSGGGPATEQERIDSAVRHVFEHCRKRRRGRLGNLPGPSIQLTDKRKTKIGARLKEALQELGSLRRAVAYLCLAADGFYADDWNDRDNYLDITKYLYDDAERVQKWVRQALEKREGLDSDVKKRARQDLQEMRQKYGEAS